MFGGVGAELIARITDLERFPSAARGSVLDDEQVVASSLNSATWSNLSVAAFTPASATKCQIGMVVNVGNNSIKSLYTAESNRTGSTGGVLLGQFSGDNSNAGYSGNSSHWMDNIALDAVQTFSARTLGSVNFVNLSSYYDSLLT